MVLVSHRGSILSFGRHLFETCNISYINSAVFVLIFFFFFLLDVLYSTLFNQEDAQDKMYLDPVKYFFVHSLDEINLGTFK